MPLYYLHIRSRSQFIEDEEGAEFNEDSGAMAELESVSVKVYSPAVSKRRFLKAATPFEKRRTPLPAKGRPTGPEETESVTVDRSDLIGLPN